MPLSFPASPSVGQTSSQNGRLYVYDGSAWLLASNVAGHASTHGSAGSDPVTPASIGAAAQSHSHSAGDITSGSLADARLSSAAQASLNLYLWSNFR